MKPDCCKEHVCPVCGKFVFNHRLSYDICDICGWEDDILDEDDPEWFTGANPMELEDYRAAYNAGGRPEWVTDNMDEIAIFEKFLDGVLEKYEQQEG